MRNLKVPIFVACLCIVVAVSSSPAWEFKMPNLNPFAKKQKPPQSRFRQEPESNSFLPKINLFPKRAPGEPTTMQKFNRNTANFFSKTKDALTPWNRKQKMPPQRPRFSGSQRTYSGSPSMGGRRQEESNNQGNWISRLNPFGNGQAESDSYDDVNDFFRQPRPRY